MDTIQYLGEYSWLLIPLGLFLGLLGYRLLKASLFIIGLFFGVLLGFWIGDFAVNPLLGVILGFVLGIAFGVIAQFLYRFALFMAGMAGGALLATVIMRESGMDSSSTDYLLWMVGSGVAGGITTLIFHRFFILVITAIIGTTMVYQGTIQAFPEVGYKYWVWIPYLVLLLIFIVVQMVGARRSHRDPRSRENYRRQR